MHEVTKNLYCGTNAYSCHQNSCAAIYVNSFFKPAVFYQDTPEPKRARTTLGAFKLREEKKETGVGSWFAKRKSEDSGYVLVANNV